MQHLSNFSETGLPLATNSGMTYLYGVSDFFHLMFEDEDVIDLTLEACAVTAAETYSRFLQFTTSLSLDSVQSALGVTIKLMTINSSASQDSFHNKFILNVPIQSAKSLTDRPFLPTAVLDLGVDFELEQLTSTSCKVTFAKPISSYGFSSRPLADGTVTYAVWAVDAVVDENLVYNAFGRFVGATPETASETYSDFVYGLFYLYTHGPTLEAFTRGLNLILGVPLARNAETVIDIRLYSETNQYVVVTNSNQYLIPFGLKPDISIGDTLKVGQQLSKAVEIKDYRNNGDWWLNLRIPEWLIPDTPVGQPNRYASAGTHFDYAMRNYLRYNTFLVKVNVDNFKNIQRFTQISDIILKVKPSYDQPIYVWSVKSDDEIVTLFDDKALIQVRMPTCEHAMPTLSTFRRDSLEDPHSRGCPTFLRWMGTPLENIVTGNGSVLSTSSTNIDGLTINGVVNPGGALGSNTQKDVARVRSLMNRGADTWTMVRSEIGHFRATAPVYSGSDSLTKDGFPTPSFRDMLTPSPALRVIPLYVTGEQDVLNKCRLLGYDDPQPGDWIVDFLGPRAGSYAINALGINRGYASGAGQARALYSTLFFKDSTAEGLSMRNPDIAATWSWAPASNEVQTNDYLVAVRTVDRTFGVYWVTSNLTVRGPAYITAADPEALVMDITQPPTRAMALQGQTMYYFVRGCRVLGYNNGGDASSQAIDQFPIDGYVPVEDVTTSYTDYLNTNVAVTRQSDISLRPPIHHRFTV